MPKSGNRGRHHGRTVSETYGQELIDGRAGQGASEHVKPCHDGQRLHSATVCPLRPGARRSLKILEEMPKIARPLQHPYLCFLQDFATTSIYTYSLSTNELFTKSLMPSSPHALRSLTVKGVWVRNLIYSISSKPRTIANVCFTSNPKSQMC